MPTKQLTDADCRNATCPADQKRRRITDSGGLYLEVTPQGSKRWFWKFYFGGKESRLALGNYPAVRLAAARAARDEARTTRRSGTNPVQQRKAERLTKAVSSATTYEAVAREFHGVMRAGWSEGHARKWLRMNELYLFQQIGSLPLDAIKGQALTAALRKVERKGILSTAQDLLSMAGQVFRYGVRSGRCERDPTPDLKGLLTPHVATHFAAILSPVEAGALLRAIDGYTGQPETVAALKLSALLFQRPGNIRAMEWTWLNLDAALLAIPAQSMKGTQRQKRNGRPHLVPLARQSLDVLTSIKPLTGHGRYVFPGARSHERPMSDGTINAALRRLDYGNGDHVAHGFRAMARTMMAERLAGIPQEMVEAQLGHGKSGSLRDAYDRSEYLEQRRTIMQTWADYLDQLRHGAELIPLRAA